jgi:hypothetical protein
MRRLAAASLERFQSVVLKYQGAALYCDRLQAGALAGGVVAQALPVVRIEAQRYANRLAGALGAGRRARLAA